MARRCAKVYSVCWSWDYSSGHCSGFSPDSLFIASQRYVVMQTKTDANIYEFGLDGICKLMCLHIQDVNPIIDNNVRHDCESLFVKRNVEEGERGTGKPFNRRVAETGSTAEFDVASLRLVFLWAALQLCFSAVNAFIASQTLLSITQHIHFS
jgi:hypothetical protein